MFLFLNRSKVYMSGGKSCSSLPIVSTLYFVLFEKILLFVSYNLYSKSLRVMKSNIAVMFCFENSYILRGFMNFGY